MRRAALAAALLVACAPMLALAEPAAVYDFDDVTASYALTFVAYAENATGDWAEKVAGGPGLPITVTFGEVHFTKGGHDAGGESFLKVSGVGGSKRFLLNSGSWPDAGTSRLFFWSAKQLVNTSVVKDFTPPVYSAELVRTYEEGNLTRVLLSTSDDGNAAQTAFWTGPPTQHLWRVVVGHATEAGLPLLPDVPGVLK